jgi:hypothetical protein
VPRVPKVPRMPKVPKVLKSTSVCSLCSHEKIRGENKENHCQFVSKYYFCAVLTLI